MIVGIIVAIKENQIMRKKQVGLVNGLGLKYLMVGLSVRNTVASQRRGSLG